MQQQIIYSMNEIFKNVYLKCLVNEISYANISKWEIHKNIKKKNVEKYKKM